MPPEYQDFRQAQKVLRGYWGVADDIVKQYGQSFADSKLGQKVIERLRKAKRLGNPNLRLSINDTIRTR